MLKIASNFYIGDTIKKSKISKIIKKLNKQRNVINLYVIIIRDKFSNLMEIVSTYELYRINEREENINVIGIAKSKEEAYDLVVMIASKITNEHTLTKQQIFKEFNISW